MGRIRYIKPDQALDFELAAMDPYAQIAYMRLPTIADKAGRLEDKPPKIKAQVLPYTKVNMDSLLDQLHPTHIIRFNGFIQILHWERDQKPHHLEQESIILGIPVDFEIKVRSSRDQGEIKVRSSRDQGEIKVISNTIMGTGTGTGTGTGSVHNGGLAPAQTLTVKSNDVVNKAAAASESFQRFWAAYPRREAKADAIRAWAKVSHEAGLIDAVLHAIEQAQQSDLWHDKKYIPLPASWLNGRRWEDEIQGEVNGRAAKSDIYI